MHEFSVGTMDQSGGSETSGPEGINHCFGRGNTPGKIEEYNGLEAKHMAETKKGK
jgi:hypothetical protein